MNPSEYSFDYAKVNDLVHFERYLMGGRNPSN